MPNIIFGGFSSAINYILGNRSRKKINFLLNFSEIFTIVEQAFADVLGNDVRPWSEEMRDDAVELYEALAWAGARSE